VVDQIAAHIDITPTLLDACDVPAGSEPKLDGRSLVPLLQGRPAAVLSPRTLYLQWHRGDAPEPGRAFAARTQQYKLLRPEPRRTGPPPPLELYDLDQDPFEQHDLAEANPEIVARMYHDYLDWFHDVCTTRGFAPSRIQIGDPRESPTVLTRQDWHLAQDGSGPSLGGFWELSVSRPGQYEIGLHIKPGVEQMKAHLRIQSQDVEQPVPSGTDRLVFRGITLTPGPARLQVWMSGGEPITSILDAEARRRDDD
jgi:hypothetical protein